MKKKFNKKQLLSSMDIACDYIAECDQISETCDVWGVRLSIEQLEVLKKDYDIRATLGNFWLEIHKRLNP